MIDRATRLVLSNDLKTIYDGIDKLKELVDMAVSKDAEKYTPHFIAYTAVENATMNLHTRVEDLVFLSDRITRLEHERDNLKEELSLRDTRIESLVKQLSENV